MRIALSILVSFWTVFAYGQAQMHMMTYTPAGSSWSTELQAWIDEIESSGGIAPGNAQLEDLETMISDLKTDGLWSKMDALYIFDQDGSEVAGRISMIDPSSYELVQTGSTVAWTSNEGIDIYASGCSCGYYDTNFNPATVGGGFAQNSAFLSVMTDHPGKLGLFEYGYLAGNGNSGSVAAYVFIGDLGSGVEGYGRINDNLSTQFSTATGTNDHYLYTISRTSSSAREHYEDATSKVSDSQTSSSPISYDFFIGTSNASGLAVLNPAGSDTEIKIAVWGSGLTDTNVSDLNTAFDTFLDSQ